MFAAVDAVLTLYAWFTSGDDGNVEFQRRQQRISVQRRRGDKRLFQGRHRYSRNESRCLNLCSDLHSNLGKDSCQRSDRAVRRQRFPQHTAQNYGRILYLAGWHSTSKRQISVRARLSQREAPANACGFCAFDQTRNMLRFGGPESQYGRAASTQFSPLRMCILPHMYYAYTVAPFLCASQHSGIMGAPMDSN